LANSSSLTDNVLLVGQMMLGQLSQHQEVLLVPI